MPSKVTLTHDGCEPWVNSFDTDEHAAEFATAWGELGWVRDDSPSEDQPSEPAQAPADVPAVPATTDPAPAEVTNPEGI